LDANGLVVFLEVLLILFRTVPPKCILPLVWKFCGCPVPLGSGFSSWKGTIEREEGVVGREEEEKKS
jgi:hypothetical protein